MNLNLLPAFLKSALHFITGLQLLLKNIQTSKIGHGLTENLLVMKLCLKWHNLSLLYIWRAGRKPNN